MHHHIGQGMRCDHKMSQETHSRCIFNVRRELMIPQDIITRCEQANGANETKQQPTRYTTKNAVLSLLVEELKYCESSKTAI